MNRHFISFAFCLFSLLVFSQDQEGSNVPSDTSTVRTKCECLEVKYELRQKILTNTQIDTKGNVEMDSSINISNFETLLALKEIRQKCAELATEDTSNQPCPIEGKFEEQDADFELLLRVIEINGQYRGCN